MTAEAPATTALLEWTKSKVDGSVLREAATTHFKFRIEPTAGGRYRLLVNGQKIGKDAVTVGKKMADAEKLLTEFHDEQARIAAAHVALGLGVETRELVVVDSGAAPQLKLVEAPAPELKLFAPEAGPVEVTALIDDHIFSLVAAPQPVEVAAADPFVKDLTPAAPEPQVTVKSYEWVTGDEIEVRGRFEKADFVAYAHLLGAQVEHVRVNGNEADPDLMGAVIEYLVEKKVVIGRFVPRAVREQADPTPDPLSVTAVTLAPNKTSVYTEGFYEGQPFGIVCHLNGLLVTNVAHLNTGFNAEDPLRAALVDHLTLADVVKGFMNAPLRPIVERPAEVPAGTITKEMWKALRAAWWGRFDQTNMIVTACSQSERDSMAAHINAGYIKRPEKTGDETWTASVLVAGKAWYEKQTLVNRAAVGLPPLEVTGDGTQS